MNITIKQIKENEMKASEQLFENLSLLARFYPTTKDFKQHFRKDMFLKNNKAAFYEVVYYLLNVLNPDLTAQKITTWPPYDSKRDTSFRGELLKYLTELNSLYPHAYIPAIMASHLISPGGYKFIKLMLKLSQLVMYEHIVKTSKDEEENILYNIVPNKNPHITKNIKETTKKLSENCNQESIKLLRDFEETYNKLTDDALNIIGQQKKYTEDISELKKIYVLKQKEFNEKHPNYPSANEIVGKMDLVRTYFEDISKIIDEFEEINKIFEFLNNSDRIVQHNKNDFKVPPEISHVVQNNDELDLRQYFHGLSIAIDKRTLDMQSYSTTYLDSNLKTVSENIKRLQQVKINLERNMDNLRCNMEKAEKVFEEWNEKDGLPKIIVTSLQDETLMDPLNLS